MERIILPRDLSLLEIEAIMHEAPSAEYEVFLMRSGCKFADSFCLGFHYDRFGALCQNLRRSTYTFHGEMQSFKDHQLAMLNETAYQTLFSSSGEAIEHLCNYTAYDLGRISGAVDHAYGFSQYPDEVNVRISEIPTRFPQIYSDLQESYGILSGRTASPEAIIHLLEQYFGKDTLPCIPFYSVKTRQEVLLPNALLSNLCGSNGGGAGNTPEEAIGHALDEIAERFAKERIYHTGLTPPDVPLSFIQDHAPDLLPIIAELESSGQFRVVVKDASLGLGLPVLCVLLVDQENQRYMVNFGAHPSFPVALERCFTEMFQFYEGGNTQMRRKKMTSTLLPAERILNGISNWVDGS